MSFVLHGKKCGLEWRKGNYYKITKDGKHCIIKTIKKSVKQAQRYLCVLVAGDVDILNYKSRVARRYWTDGNPMYWIASYHYSNWNAHTRGFTCENVNKQFKKKGTLGELLYE